MKYTKPSIQLKKNMSYIFNHPHIASARYNTDLQTSKERAS